MASDNSAKPILVAGACGAVLLLGVAWMFAAASGDRAQQEAVARYEALGGDTFATSALESAAEAEAEPAATETEAADAEPAPEAEEAKTEEPEPQTEETETAEAAQEPETEEAKTEEPEPQAEETETAEAAQEPEAEEAKAEEPEPQAEETETAEAAQEPEPEEAKVEESEPQADEAKTEEAAKEPEAAETEVAAAAPAAASVEGDAGAGKKVFRKCKACHVADEEKNRVGPHLVDIVGRAVGIVEGFSYSKVFEEAKAAGKTWTPEELDAYLEAPRKVMPGTKMAFAGLRKADDRANVIAYLAEGK